MHRRATKINSDVNFKHSYPLEKFGIQNHRSINDNLLHELDQYSV